MAIGRTAPPTSSPAIVRVWAAVYPTFHTRVSSSGVFACRRVNFEPPPAPWSYHAWGQAWDITGASSTLDELYRFLNARRAALRIQELLWRVPNHYDHLHVAAGPDRSGQVPPCASGEAVVHAQAVAALPSERAAVPGESWAPAAREGARQLVKAAGRMEDAVGAVRSILDRG